MLQSLVTTAAAASGAASTQTIERRRTDIVSGGGEDRFSCAKVKRPKEEKSNPEFREGEESASSVS
jgi:hypothetical protein